MTEHPHDEHFLQRYLLGEVTEEERQRLQESYFVDAGLFSRLLSAESDLIDAYGRGELTAAERERFEQRFGNVRGIEQRLNFAGMLSRAADQHSTSMQQAEGSRSSFVKAPPSSLPWLSSISPSLGSRIARASVAAIAAVIVVMAVLVAANRWLPGRHTGPEGELARSQTDQPTAPPNTKPATPVTPDPIKVDEKSTTAGSSSASVTENRRTPLPKAQLASVAVVLHGGMTREGGQATSVVLSPAARSVQTQLELPAELQTRAYSSFQVALQTVSGQEVIKRSNLKISKGRGSSFIRVSIPAELLTTRDYVVLLNGQRSDGTEQYLRGYFFSVVRK
jgi:hypothetical protein